MLKTVITAHASKLLMLINFEGLIANRLNENRQMEVGNYLAAANTMQAALE
jgi:hypothetical protein